ncbi:DNA polymerase IV [Leadbetterella sp. DM7]|uniref:DNA polymerase IV n=1 Tax=Leadbetterella sp. DM7 TaxID=3235085 RepID=UPI00349EC001
MDRKIIHIDMDAFYASVEQRDFPELRGKPVGVGGLSGRGVLTTASYEARKFGVRSAMPTWMAKQKCPDLIVVRPRFGVYKEVSDQIRGIFREYTPLIEPLSLDEAYLDVTENLKNMQYATDIAREIKVKIFETTGLTASAGVSFNKFLAKIASDLNKPDGLCVITPKKAPRIIDALPIERFHGIGKVTAEKMRQFGVYNGADLKQQPLEWLTTHFGKAGTYYFRVAHGEDNRPVDASSVRKSVSVEDTFAKDTADFEEQESQLLILAQKVWEWVEKKQIFGRTVTLKVKFHDFSIMNRSRSSAAYIKDYDSFKGLALELFKQSFDPSRPVRLLGIGLSNLNNNDKPQFGQMELRFEDEGN